MAYKANGLSVLYYSPGGVPGTGLLSAGSRITFPDASGVYGDLRAGSVSAVSAATHAIDFSIPFNDGGLDANRTFTESNKFQGRHTFLYIDETASPNNYVPTFSTNILWPNGTEPTWSDHNRWRIGLLCMDSTLVLANPMGFDS